MNWRIILFGFFLFLASSIMGQSEVGNGATNLVYRTDQAFGGGFYAKGYFFDFHYGKRKTATLNQKYYAGFSNLKHQKETKSFNPIFEDAKGYYFGKLNAFWQLKLGFGYQKTLTPKLQKNGVAISISGVAGASVGMLKPVYIEVIEQVIIDSTVQGVLKTEKYNAQGNEIIYGRASWLKGVDEIKFRPGLFLKGELEFEYSGYKESIQSVVTGLEIQWYPSEIEIMAIAENSRIFARLFIGFKFGSRYL
ncbi:MAG: hypothetical protein ACI9YL_001303 [Luteibaculaceae bacterium]